MDVCFDYHKLHVRFAKLVNTSLSSSNDFRTKLANTSLSAQCQFATFTMLCLTTVSRYM